MKLSHALWALAAAAALTSAAAADPQAPAPNAAPETKAAAPSPAPAAPAGPAIDRPAMYKHLQRTFNTPPGVEFELGDLTPAAVDGLYVGTLKSSFRGNTQSHQVLVTKDGRYYIMSDLFKLGESSIPGMLAPEDKGEEGPPMVHVSKDLKYFFVGEPRDLKVDPAAALLAKIKLSGAMSRGGGDSAPVTLVEYSDLECPFCRNAHLALDDKLEATYGKKVRWVFKHFPLTSIDPWAYPAAIAVACAEKQKPEAAWKVQTAIFHDQESINPGNLRDKALEAAKSAGLKTAAWETCFDKQETKARIDEDMAEARAVRVNSTPTLILNGRLMAGFRDFDALKTMIDDELAEKGIKPEAKAEGKPDKKASKKDDAKPKAEKKAEKKPETKAKP